MACDVIPIARLLRSCACARRQLTAFRRFGNSRNVEASLCGTEAVRVRMNLDVQLVILTF